MSFRDLFGRCRWGASLCILVLAFALAACGDDDGDATNNGTNNTAADAGPDITANDGGGDAEEGPDAQADAGGDADAAPDEDAQIDAGGPDADATADADASLFELAGVYDTNFGAEVTITDDEWVTNSADFPAMELVIVEFDNDENFAITQNPQDSGGTFNKEVWTEPNGEGVFYHCTVDYGHETAEDARNTSETADDTDPENGGCANFSWTKLTPQ